MDKEIWRDIEGLEERYQVSNKGRIKSLLGKKPRILSPSFINGGYLLVNLRYSKGKLVHRLVAKAFIPNPENKSEVNHIDGDKTNNNVENLEWVTPKENTTHAFLMNLVHRSEGEKSPRAKFTKQQILSIREEWIPNSKEHSARALAKKYGVSSSTIERIVNRKRYKNI